MDLVLFAGGATLTAIGLAVALVAWWFIVGFFRLCSLIRWQWRVTHLGKRKVVWRYFVRGFWIDWIDLSTDSSISYSARNGKWWGYGKWTAWAPVEVSQ